MYAQYPANRPDRVFQLRHVASNIETSGRMSLTEADICRAAAQRLETLEKVLEQMADDMNTDPVTTKAINCALGRVYR